MKLRIFKGILFLSLSSLILSCDNESRVDDSNVVEYADPAENDQPINKNEKHFDSDYKTLAWKAMSEGKMEIDLANIALEKSENSEVKELAQMLKTEFQISNKNLEEIIQSNTWQMPKEMTDNDAVNVKQIKTMPKEKFDTHYLHMVANNLTKLSAMLEKYENKTQGTDSVHTTSNDTSNNIKKSNLSGNNNARDNYYPELNDWIETNLSKVKSHINKVEEVQLSLEGQNM